MAKRPAEPKKNSIPSHGAAAALIPKPTLSTRMKVLQTAVMNAAGISVTRYFMPLLFFARKTVRAQSVNTANV